VSTPLLALSRRGRGSLTAPKAIVASADTPEAEYVRAGGEALARRAGAALRVLQVDTDATA
jgi:hypothetical protein